MAFAWAVEPEALMVPPAHWTEPDELEPAPAAPVDELLLELASEPQPARAKAPARAKPPRRADRESFTAVVSFASCHVVRAPRARRAGRARLAPGGDGRGGR